jgi:hypothetical protein
VQLPALSILPLSGKPKVHKVEQGTCAQALIEKIDIKIKSEIFFMSGSTYLIACSALIDKEIEKKAMDSGFD